MEEVGQLEVVGVTTRGTPLVKEKKVARIRMEDFAITERGTTSKKGKGKKTVTKGTEKQTKQSKEQPEDDKEDDDDEDDDDIQELEQDDESNIDNLVAEGRRLGIRMPKLILKTKSFQARLLKEVQKARAKRSKLEQIEKDESGLGPDDEKTKAVREGGGMVHE